MHFDLAAPEICLIVTAILVIFTDLFVANKRWLPIVSIGGIFAAAIFTISMWSGDHQLIFNNMLAVDNYALFFKLLFLGIAALLIMASVDYVGKFVHFQGEYHTLVLLATLGMLLMAATTDLISIYIAI